MVEIDGFRFYELVDDLVAGHRVFAPNHGALVGVDEGDGKLIEVPDGIPIAPHEEPAEEERQEYDDANGNRWEFTAAEAAKLGADVEEAHWFTAVIW